MQRRGASVRSASARRGGEQRALRPRRLGVDVVGRDRGDAAEVVDAGLEQARELGVREVGRRLHGDVERHQQARDGDRPEVILERRLGRVGHLRAGLGAEVLDDDLLQVAVPLVQLAQREQRLDALAARLADADQDAARVRDRQAPGAVDRVEAHLGQLVGRAEVRHRRAARGASLAVSSMIPCDAVTSRSASSSSSSRMPGFACGRRPVSRSTSPAQCARYAAVVGKPSRVELLAGRAVAQLGLVAEREERLVAARVAARTAIASTSSGVM